MQGQGQKNTKRREENKKKMHLALCRRCPIAYHRKCMPRDISSVAEGSVSRKWKTGGTVFFYCQKHKMVENLSSATRDHLNFPKRDAENQFPIVYARKRFKGASKKRGAPMEEGDHGNKKSDPVQKSRDINLRADEQTEGPQHSMVDHNASTGFVLSFAPKSLFPLPYPGTCGWLDD